MSLLTDSHARRLIEAVSSGELGGGSQLGFDLSSILTSVEVPISIHESELEVGTDSRFNKTYEFPMETIYPLIVRAVVNGKMGYTIPSESKGVYMVSKFHWFPEVNLHEYEVDMVLANSYSQYGTRKEESFNFTDIKLEGFLYPLKNQTYFSGLHFDLMSIDKVNFYLSFRNSLNASCKTGYCDIEATFQFIGIKQFSEWPDMSKIKT